jgi:MurNAc alpha-1-phosphate uridylyltransferase
LAQALPLLTKQCEQFVVVNGDVWTDYPFERFHQIKLSPERWAHLVLVPKPPQQEKGDFGLLKGRVKPQGALTFSGLSVLHQGLLKEVPVAFIKLAPILRQAMETNRVTGELYEGIWEDVGTPERLAKLNQPIS